MSGAVVETFLASMAAHDWDAMSACLADDVVRVGPYGDTYEGRGTYVAFLADLLPTLPGYALEVTRITDAGGGLVFAELSETVDVRGVPLRTPEALVFEIDGSGCIARVDVYMRTSGS